jgi:ankyrin repeat protein
MFEQKGAALFQKDINNYTLLEYITKIFCDFFQIPYQVYDANNTAFGAQLLHQIVASPLVLKMAIEYGADINSRNDRGDTAVMDAAARGYTDSVEYLISQGANLKDINQEGENIMHKLSTSFNERDKDGQLAMIAILEKNGVLGELLNQKNRSGKTPLDIARENGKAGPLVEMLESKMMTKLMNELDRTANPAAQLKEALGAKSEEERIYIRDTINQLDSKGQLALNKGVDSRDVLDVLIQNGADVNARNAKGETAAMEAAAMGLSSSVKFLVEKGANLTVRDNDGQNLLHKLAARKDIPAKEISGILDILTDDSIVGEKSALMELLNQKNEAGKTPLDTARESGNHELVTQVNNRLMLDAGKRASIKDVKNLAGSGVDIRVIDNKGENMLHKLASGWGVESIAQSNFMSALQEKGVLAEMIQQKNDDGKTPLDIAKEKLKSVSREVDSPDCQ